MRIKFGWFVFCTTAFLLPRAEAGDDEPDTVKCANLVYAGSKSSVCFSDKFLANVRIETNVDVATKFTTVKLKDVDIYEYPFAIMTGEGDFALFEEERQRLRAYLTRGGFLLASAGCSCSDWDKSFRREMKIIFPEIEMVKIPKEHALFRTVYDIPSVQLKNKGNAYLNGLIIEDKIVMIYSSEGLNDTGTVEGCCCCGGNEVKNSKEINTNIFAYALTH